MFFCSFCQNEKFSVFSNFFNLAVEEQLRHFEEIKFSHILTQD
tara:strand:+ start:2161 stop:2289 length:129 start_codon:yes stop_codon:yes gene_type:complete